MKLRVWVARPGAVPDPAAFSSSDAARAQRYHRSEDRDRFVTGRIMIADLLRREHGLGPGTYRLEPRPVIPGEGKPWLVAADGRPLPHVSIAHSGNRVLLAVCDNAEIGVDVERADAGERLAEGGWRELLDDTEQVAFAGVELAHRGRHLVRTFTRKEAVLKAIGLGLAVDPRSLRLTPRGERPARFDSRFARPVRVADLDVGEGYYAAVACCGEQLPEVMVCPWTQSSNR